MTWRDDLLTASLNGVEFLYRNVGSRGGRRTIPFEFPGRDDPFVEDIGRSARKFSLDAFLLGDFYHIDLVDLVAVLETAGDLEFVHPYQGVLTVRLLGDYEVVEEDSAGGRAQIRFTLHESGLAFPLIAVDTAAVVTVLAAEAIESIVDNTRFDLAGAIQDVLNAVANGIEVLNSTMRAVNGKIGATLGSIGNISGAITSFTNQVNTLLNTPAALMTALIALKSSLIQLVKAFTPEPDAQGTQSLQPTLGTLLMDVLATVNADILEASVVPTNTPGGQQEATAFEQLNLANRGGMLAAVADGLVAIDLDSADDAIEIQEIMVAEFDKILGTVGLDSAIYDSFAALKGAVVEHLTVQQQNLPLLATITPPQTVPALVLAYQLYADATRDAEIIRRNRIRHPGFVPGGRPLEVASFDD